MSSSIEDLHSRMETLDGLPVAYPLPDLSEAEYEALRDAIVRNGVLVPVKVSDDGVLLDGYHRWRCCIELGMPDPPIEVVTLSKPQEGVEQAIVLNVARRQMDPVTRAECVRALAAARGVRLQRQGAQKAETDTVAVLAQSVGVSERTARRDQRLLELPDDLREGVRSGDLSAKAALARAAKPAPAPAPKLDPHGEYHALVIEPDWHKGFGSIAHLKLPDGRTIPDLVHPDGCHLYLRTPSENLGKAPALLSEWGFDYAACLTVETSPRPSDYFIQRTTHLMFGVRDQPISRKLTTLFTGGSVRDAVRKCLGESSPGPALGLRVRDGNWTAYDPETGDVLDAVVAA
jgi:hypothetical protein